MTDSAITLTHTDAAAQWATSTDRKVLFTVERDGEDATDYTMPARPNAGLALKYLKMARSEGGADVAMSWLIETAVGSEGYDAFADELAGIEDPKAAIDVMRDVVGRIMKVAMGGLEAPKA
jgi:hypothetical protein